MFIERIENVLDANHLKLKQREVNIQNPAVEEVLKQGLRKDATSVQTRVKEKICIPCYEGEWKAQFLEI